MERPGTAATKASTTRSSGAKSGNSKSPAATKPGPGSEHAAAQARLEAAMHQLEDYVDELSEVGCDLKDYQTGLIDFIGRHQGRDICLCWKLGEERINFWHELDAGYRGRQPVAELEER